ncbi:MAG: global cell cycle regulator GcrA-like protein [Rhodospirillales bacterium]|jgi:GcrA cell cycle regulator|uniref:GcrA family cell cycle regulator n=1 Tax=Hwanghaeella sp. 1Z406 TaxID=3402811 RepID=UPI000C9431A2|nr:global cell cycle regulator GcrA-like protein [Rhodospirillales bacterium]|tara:strand:+ start:34216 stop:34578 length:363 start_codon:yes stop_codon:yes gene_type:complete
MEWTDDRVTLLKGMWTNGYTARQIAEKLGGVTRNAVIGKAHRLGLSSRPQQVKRHTPLPIPNVVERHCQWPIGHPGTDEFHFCGKSAVPGKPYCQAHCGVAYRRKDDGASSNNSAATTSA